MLFAFICHAVQVSLLDDVRCVFSDFCRLPIALGTPSRYLTRIWQAREAPTASVWGLGCCFIWL
jgi:hypothetical protein